VSPHGRGRPGPPSGPLPLPRTQPSVYDYGVIGNLHTVALVSRYGAIDWACFPHFSSPSTFGRLVDWDRGGSFEVRPRRFRSSRQRYLPGTNVLVTEFVGLAGDRIRLTDFMAIDPLHPAIVEPRLVRIVESGPRPVPLEVRIEPRFQYGCDRPTWRAHVGRYFAQGPRGDHLEARLSWPGRIRDGALCAPGVLAPRQRAAFEITWEASDWSDPPESLLVATTTFWREWIGRPAGPLQRIGGRWHDPVQRSELLLKLLSHSENGTFVAAPTTSIPEWPGGSRNWDYRYVWIRDAAFTAQAFALLGHAIESFAYLRWVVRRVELELAHGGHLRVFYDASGGRDVTERDLGLAGYRGARPVRVGNAAAGQFQLDIYGEVLDAALAIRDQDPTRGFLRPYWGPLSQLADRVAEVWRTPDRGLWEVRGPPRQFVHSKLMAWVALDRAIQIARLLGGDGRVPRWRKEARTIARFVLEEGWDAERGTFVQAVGRPEVDSSSLRIPLVGFLPFGDARVQATVRAVMEDLSDGPFLRRYESDDGLPGREGHFLLCSFWLIECLARSGRRAEAVSRWRQILRVGSPLGLYSEEYDPATRQPLGNYPQAFTHMGLLRAAVALGHLPLPKARRGPTRPGARGRLPSLRPGSRP
jgi:GH15 family glucan-1,4-alpha-glucosidase